MAYSIGGVTFGNLLDYLFFFQNGSVDANWQGASKGFVGDVAVNGIVADERTSGFVPYAGTIYTNDTTLGAWQQIVDANAGQASASYNQVALINALQSDLIGAIQQINALPATPGYTSINSSALDGLNTQNGINEVFVINVTSGFQISDQIDITGDAGDVFILRWDTDANFANGYQGQVKFQSGGAIVPHGGLTPSNFIHVAGEIGSSGGGTTPPPPYPQGPRFNDGQGALINGGQDFSGGGFFTGYWLTTGSPDAIGAGGLWVGQNQSLSNGIFVGGWYTLATAFSMTSGTSGVYVSPNPNTFDQPAIDIEKYVWDGTQWVDADNPPGPSLQQGTNPQFRYVVTNTGNVTLNNISVTDNKLGPIGTISSLAPGASQILTATGTWALGLQTNIGTAATTYNGQQLSDSDPANYTGVPVPAPAIDIEKFVWDGTQWVDADNPPGPSIQQGTNPQFRYVVTNTGNVTLTNVAVTDNVLGPIATIPSLAPGASQTFTDTGTWALGPQTNIATASTTYNGQPVSDSDSANYTGVPVQVPVIDIEKYVWDGTQWVDADNPPGPSIPQGTNPQYRYVVTNTGNVTLTNIQVTDDVLGPIGTISSLAPGASQTFTDTGTWALGLHTNIGTASTTYNGQPVSDSDPANYTGVPVPAPAIDIEKYVWDGTTWVDADNPPGPSVPQNTSPQFRYVVTNTGNVTLTNVQVTDNVLGPITTIASLTPGASQTYFASGTWALGPHTNIGTASTTYNGQPVSDSDPANYTGVPVPGAAIDIEKYVWDGTQWVDADNPPGPSLQQGTNPQFLYVVTNTGNVTLTDITVTDDVLGTIGTIASLAPGASQNLTASGTWVLGQHTNIGTATTTYNGQTVSDSDPANYTGVPVPAPAIDIEKYVWDGTTWVDADSPPGPTLQQGTNPLYRFAVTNTGNVTLANISVTDNVLGPIGTISSLAPGASQNLTASGTFALGLHTNIGTASTTYNGQLISDTDPANYTGVPVQVPAIDIEKYVWDGTNWVDADNPPGPTLQQGTSPQFRYVVTNIGNVTLTNIDVKDDVLGTIATIASLAPGASQTFTSTGTWALGLQTNIATASTTYNGQLISDTDPANYTGVPVPAPAIDIEKYVWDGTNWVDADNPPGPSLPQNISPQFRYVVTNTGNVTLTNVNVTDDKLGPITTITSLAPGASQTFTATGTWALGQQTNIGTATTTYNGQQLSDSDPANYTGTPIETPAINIKKYVWDGTTWVDANNPPGPSIPQGTNPQFRIVVTNTGNVALTSVAVTDNVLGPITTIPSLVTGASQTFTVTGTWAPGQHTNIATATTIYNGQQLSDSDPANYTGIPTPRPAINIKKYVWDGTQWVDADNPPGPNIPQGTNPQFRIVVTNTGNVALTNVVVTDNVLGSIETIPNLAIGASQTFFVTGTWAPGQQVNTATASTIYNGQPVTDSDQAHYFGTIVPTPGITVKKLVSPDGGKTFVDAETAPGPIIPQGTNPIFRFIVTNTGNVALTNITLTDTVFGTITVPNTTLTPGQFFTIERTGVWSPCEHMNVATVTGKYGTATVTDSDQAHYAGLPNPTMFKQFSIEENVSIPNQKPTAEDILDANVSVVITDVHAIKTPKGTSYEGQIMTGWKLIVEGRLVQNVVYVANDHSQSVHAAEFSIPFSTFIILPENYKQCQPLQVEGIVEDVYVKLIDGRRIFKNITLRIEAKPKC